MLFRLIEKYCKITLNKPCYQTLTIFNPILLPLRNLFVYLYRNQQYNYATKQD